MRVIVAHEKHEDRILEADTDEQWAEASLQLLTDRFNDGYWYNDPESEPSEFSDLPAADLTDEEIAALPGYTLRDTAKRVRKAAQSEKREMEQEVKWYKAAKEVVEEQILDFRGETKEAYRARTGGVLQPPGSGYMPLAWYLLKWRNEHEYEGVELKETS